MIRNLIILLVIFFSGAASACECNFDPLTDDSVRAAKNLFVFRLVSAEIISDDLKLPATSQISGSIEIVETIRGKPTFKTIIYNTFNCCGSRLDVGHYYVAFSSESGVQFLGNSGNLVSLGDWYDKKFSPRKDIEKVLTKKATVKQAFIAFSRERIDQTPPPPPPPCPQNTK